MAPAPFYRVSTGGVDDALLKERVVVFMVARHPSVRRWMLSCFFESGEERYLGDLAGVMACGTISPGHILEWHATGKSPEGCAIRFKDGLPAVLIAAAMHEVADRLAILEYEASLYSEGTHPREDRIRIVAKLRALLEGRVS